jgi:flagellin
VEIGTIAAGATVAGQAANVVEAINKKSADTGVVAYIGGTNAISLKSTNGEEISVKYGENATAANVTSATGLLERNATEGVGSVSSIDISTAAGAQKAIGIIDKAIDQVSSTRAELLLTTAWISPYLTWRISLRKHLPHVHVSTTLTLPRKLLL